MIGAPARDSSRAGAPRPTRRPTAGRMRRRDALTGCLFIAPQLLGIVLFVVVPLLLVVGCSFQEWNVLSGAIRFVGTENYEKLFDDPQLGPVLFATATFSIGLVALNIPLALLLAVLLNRGGRGITYFRT